MPLRKELAKKEYGPWVNKAVAHLDHKGTQTINRATTIEKLKVWEAGRNRKLKRLKTPSKINATKGQLDGIRAAIEKLQWDLEGYGDLWKPKPEKNK